MNNDSKYIPSGKSLRMKQGNNSCTHYYCGPDHTAMNPIRGQTEKTGL